LGVQSPASWTLTRDGGVTLAVRLTPKGGRDTIDGIELLANGRAVLKARVRVAPREGEANAALCELLAKAVGVPASSVMIIGVATARIKRLSISGHGPTLIAALEKIAATR
jgi:uncharacterized protein